jgi:DNA-binding transcriptional MerR regulator
MDYTIGEVAQLASVSERTLRYYDELGLVCPKRDRGQLYRLYSKEDLKRLQTVLFYRELDFDLATIKAIMEDPGFSTLQALEDQRSGCWQDATAWRVCFAPWKQPSQKERRKNHDRQRTV